ncbi:MAG: hypothetical protein V1685_01695 [Parcubacteria group bacterium]
MSSPRTDRRQQKLKNALLEEFRKIPIVQVACSKHNVSRASYYRWRTEDTTFAAAADAAIDDGVLMVNDIAESQLLTAIRDGNMTGIIFWLKSHHKTYSTKVEVEATVRNLALTPEQEAVVRRALTLAQVTQGDLPHDA